MTEPSRWTQLRQRFSDGFNRWESAVERIPARRFLAELPWLVGVLLGWRICWRDGDAMVLDERVTGYQWADYMNNCWLVANRITERYDGWRGIVHAGICGSAGEALDSYPNGAILVASVSVFILIFCAGLAARALGGAWAGFLAAVTLAWVPTVSQAAHWGNSTPVIAAGTAIALAFGSVAMRWPKLGFAAVAGAGACLAWAADKRGLLIIPGVVGMGVVAALFAPKMAEGKLGVVALGHALRKRLPEAVQSRLQTPAKLQRPMTWLTLNQRKFLILPALSLGLLVFPLRTAWLGQTTNTEWESQMDAESMRQVHDGTAQRWTQSAELDRRWTNWEGMSPELGRWVPPFTSVIRSGGSSGRDTELMNRCKDLVEDQFLVVPDFFYTDCSRATLAHNTRENLAKITALPLGLVWISLPLCLLPARQRWKGVLSGGALLAAVWAMWLAMASLNVMPTRYLIQFTVGASLMVPIGMGRLIYTVFPQSLAWLVSGLCGLGLWSWTMALDINDRDSEHTWSYNDSVKGGLNDYYAHSQQLREYLEPEDDFLDCSDKGLSIWLLPDYTRFGTPLLKVDDAGRCMQWISWAPENGTRWIAIDPACKYRPQDAPQGGPQANNQDSHVSLEPSLQTNGWDLVLDSYPDDSRNSLRGPRAQSQQIQCGEGRFQLWKRES